MCIQCSEQNILNSQYQYKVNISYYHLLHSHHNKQCKQWKMSKSHNWLQYSQCNSLVLKKHSQIYKYYIFDNWCYNLHSQYQNKAYSLLIHLYVYYIHSQLSTLNNFDNNLYIEYNMPNNMMNIFHHSHHTQLCNLYSYYKMMNIIYNMLHCNLCKMNLIYHMGQCSLCRQMGCQGIMHSLWDCIFGSYLKLIHNLVYKLYTLCYQLNSLCSLYHCILSSCLWQ